MVKKTILYLPLLGILIFAGCQTYHMTAQNLVEQFADTHEVKKTNNLITQGQISTRMGGNSNLFVALPLFIPFTVTGNSLQEVKVLDKDEKECLIRVTNHTGIRIYKKDGTRKTFYFDTLIIKDSLVTGKNDHFIGVDIKPINLNDIQKIELQE